MTSRRHCNTQKLIRKLLLHKKALVLGNITALLATLLSVLVPLLIPILVDELLLGKSHGLIDFIKTHLFVGSAQSYVLFILVCILLLRFVSVWLSVIQSKIFTTLSKHITYTLRIQALEHLKKTSLKAYETLQPGAISSKLITDIETIDAFISTTVSKLILAILMLFFSALVLLWIHWQLALFILLTNPIVIYMTAKMARKVGLLKKEENKAFETFQSSINEILDVVAQIKALNQSRYFFQKVKSQAKLLMDRSVRFGYESDKAQKYSYLIFLSGYEMFRAVSILAVAYSDLSVGLMLAIFSYLWVMVTPTQDIISFQYTLSNAKTACARLNEIFAYPVEPQRDNRCNPFVSPKGVAIHCKEVSFGYTRSHLVLTKVSLSIRPKSKVAIVGPSGSGKSTLAQLIAGLHSPQEGEIFYNECRYDAISLETLRENTHLILQHPKLFNATMRFNLTLGKDYTSSQIDKAIKIAQLQKVIDRLEKGLETLVGKDGVRLSGGERQRVAIARMVLADPSIIIFDESTASLDVQTELKLFAKLEEFWSDKTVITIAHRLSTIEKAEFVYVLQDGRLIDSGTPKELSQKERGYFSRMQ